MLRLRRASSLAAVLAADGMIPRRADRRTEKSFRWTAEGSMDHGASWRLFVAVFARRTSP
jgi:hypothetical protein